MIKINPIDVIMKIIMGIGNEMGICVLVSIIFVNASIC